MSLFIVIKFHFEKFSWWLLHHRWRTVTNMRFDKYATHLCTFIGDAFLTRSEEGYIGNSPLWFSIITTNRKITFHSWPSPYIWYDRPVPQDPQVPQDLWVLCWEIRSIFKRFTPLTIFIKYHICGLVGCIFLYWVGLAYFSVFHILCRN